MVSRFWGISPSTRLSVANGSRSSEAVKIKASKKHEEGIRFNHNGPENTLFGEKLGLV
jgi:hypothetical protein